MKKLFVILLLFITTISFAQEATTFILVRHAEKASDGTKNPALTDEGIARANKILSMFKEADITAIYSTDYKRTKMTVAPIAEAKKMEITSYDPRKLEDFTLMLKDIVGGTVIISGHSNTTPTLANLLLGEEKFEQFDEADYGNLLIITMADNGKPALLHIRY